jgi:hypothetical protein
VLRSKDHREDADHSHVFIGSRVGHSNLKDICNEFAHTRERLDSTHTRVTHRRDVIHGIESGHRLGAVGSFVHGGCDQIGLALRTPALSNLQCETRSLRQALRESDRYSSPTDCDDESWPGRAERFVGW